jgi:hypothetical protein
MSNATKRLRASLEKMRIPDLQRKFEEATGETTRSPNKTFLVRRIIEAMEGAARASREAPAPAAEPVDGDGGRGYAAESRADASNTQAAEAQADPTLAEAPPVGALAEERVHNPCSEEPSSSANGRARCDDASALHADEGNRPGEFEEPDNAAASEILADRVQHDGAEQHSLPMDDPNVVAGNEAFPSSDTSMSEAASVETSSSPEGAEEGDDEPLAGTAANEARGDQAASEDSDQARNAASTRSAAPNALAGLGRRRNRRAAEGDPDARGGAGEPADANATASNRLPRGALTGLTTEELQAKYLEVVGRPTGSTDKPYLMWKIREATKGKIPTGPRSHGRRTSQGDDVMVLPLRLPATTVDAMDHAWHSRGIRTRMHFLREAIRLHLERLGATEAASLLAREGTAAEAPL